MTCRAWAPQEELEKLLPSWEVPLLEPEPGPSLESLPVPSEAPSLKDAVEIAAGAQSGASSSSGHAEEPPGAAPTVAKAWTSAEAQEEQEEQGEPTGLGTPTGVALQAAGEARTDAEDAAADFACGCAACGAPPLEVLRDSQCSICFEPFLHRQTARTLPCGHHFHAPCIDPWLTRNSDKCPVDSRYVRPDQEGPVDATLVRPNQDAAE